MTTPLVFGIYEQASVGVGGSPSFWTHPLDERLSIDRLPFWRNLAVTIEQAGLDLLFFGDVLGLYDNYQQSHAGAVKWAVEAPAYDPLIHVAALSALTKDLAFGLTASTTYEHPFAFARRLSTLDHLSDGRIGWNVVTSYLDNAARNFGLDGQIPHDRRYDRADEFLDVVYKLWEGSWADDAVVASKSELTYARGDRVRAINHQGDSYRVAGPHLTPPSTQRTPVLFQAGWSPRGREFAAKHAEVIFVGPGTKEEHAAGLRDIRQRATDLGRDGGEIRAVSAIRVIVGRTESEAQAKYDSLQDNYHLEAQLVSYAGDTGIDLSAYADDEPISLRTEGFSSNLVGEPGKGHVTAGDLRRAFSRISRGRDDALFIGTPTQIVDAFERHSAATGLNGYLIAQYISPGTTDDFVELVVPELIRRGLLDPSRRQGTLRSRLRDDRADRLPAAHAGAGFRHQS